MGTHVLLNNVDHKDLKVATGRSALLGDNVMSCIAFCNEFRDLQAYYPIVFATGEQLMPVALMGLVKGENLFLSESGWDNDYVPLALAMQPFLLGYSQPAGEPRQTVIHIDMDSPRIRADGEPVFLPMGGNAPMLEQSLKVLNKVQYGSEMNTQFIAALEKYDLLEPFTLSMSLKDGANVQFEGYQTINEERLAGLGGDQLAELHAQGFLQQIYMVLASLSNFSDLLRRKDMRIARR